MQNLIREDLLKQLYFLTVREWPVYAHELVLPEDADRLLHDAHEKAFVRICLLADHDTEARGFKSAVYASITKPIGGRYDTADLIRSARNLAVRTLKRLQAEQAKNAEEVKSDPVGNAKRQYLKFRSEYDPFCADANVAIEGMPDIPKQSVTLNRDGSICTDF